MSRLRKARAAHERRAVEPAPTGRRVRAVGGARRHDRRSAAGCCRCRRSIRRSWSAPRRPRRATGPTSATATSRRQGLRSSAASVGGSRRSCRGRPAAAGPAVAAEGAARARARRPSRARSRGFGSASSAQAAPAGCMTQVTGGDPGYGETSKMLAESALCLAFDELPGARRPADAGGRHGAGAGRAAAGGRNRLLGRRLELPRCPTPVRTGRPPISRRSTGASRS